MSIAMDALGPHATFIIASYAATAAVLLALIAWLIIDGRTQRARLADLEARGIRRRSARAAGDAAKAG